MAIRVRTVAGLPSGLGVRVLGGGGRVSFGSPAVPVGGGPAAGGPLNPLTLLTDGTPLLFVIDPSVNALYRQFDDAVTPYYGKYATFVCPSMVAGETLNIRFGVQTDNVDYLDTYMYLFEGSTFTLGGETLIDQDDDGGSGDYDIFENTLLEIPEGTLTPGQPYILELTTYGDGDVGNVKVIATVSIPYTSAAGFYFGGVTEDDGDYYLRVVATDGANASLVSGFPVGSSFTSSYVDSGNTPAVIGTEVSKGVYLITSGGPIWRAADVDDDVWAYNDPVGEVADPLAYTGVGTGITLNDGFVSTPVDPGGTYPYLSGSLVTLDTTDPLKGVSINIPPGFLISSMPLDLSTVSFPSAGTYGVITQQGVSFDLNVSIPTILTLDDGVTTTTVVDGSTYPYTAGDAVTLDTTDPNKSFYIAQSPFFFIGTMPQDLSLVTFPSSGLYSVVTGMGTGCLLNVTVPVFSPDDLPNLAAWYKADAITPVAHGAAVTSWPDSSGNGNDLNTVLGTPTYWDVPEGTPTLTNPGVDFDGSSYIYRDNPTGLPGSADSKTVYVVLSRGIAQGRRFKYRAFGYANGAASMIHAGFDPETDQQGLSFGFNTAALPRETTARPYGDSAVVMSLVYNGGDTFDLAKTYINGVEGTGGSPSVPGVAGPPDRVSIGFAAGGTYWIGRVREVIVYSAAHDATARGQVESYLSSKWNVALGSTPSLNPACSEDTYYVTPVDTSAITTSPVVVNDAWGPGTMARPSRTRGVSYLAENYLITLFPVQAGTYRFNLDSATEDTYLCLRTGPCLRSSTLIAQDDDGGPGSNSQIDYVFDGLSTVNLIAECTAFDTFSGAFENFTLTITKIA